MDREHAKALFRAVAGRHLPSNARRYSYLTVDAEPPVNAMLGCKADYKPIAGKVVDAIDGAIVVKTARTDFALVSHEILPFIPDVGSTVRITPYARRLFDGSRLDAPLVEHQTLENGLKIQTRTIRLGDNRTPLPVQAERSTYLQDLIRQIEEMKAPDGFRTVAQMLVDANATAFMVVDPSDNDDIIATRPEISFSVCTSRFKGRVSVVYWRVPDLYHVHFAPESGQSEEVADVDFMSLGGVLCDRIDDGEWRMAKVEIERKSSGQRKGKANA
jgi:hypothetical protein